MSKKLDIVDELLESANRQFAIGDKFGGVLLESAAYTIKFLRSEVNGSRNLLTPHGHPRSATPEECNEYAKSRADTDFSKSMGEEYGK